MALYILNKKTGKKAQIIRKEKEKKKEYPWNKQPQLAKGTLRKRIAQLNCSSTVNRDEVRFSHGQARADSSCREILFEASSKAVDD